MEKAVKILKEHETKNFSDFDQSALDNEIQQVKQEIVGIDGQLGDSGKN